jgi:hypothetical protein
MSSPSGLSLRMGSREETMPDREAVRISYRLARQATCKSLSIKWRGNFYDREALRHFVIWLLRASLFGHYNSYQTSEFREERAFPVMLADRMVPSLASTRDGTKLNAK